MYRIANETYGGVRVTLKKNSDLKGTIRSLWLPKHENPDIRKNPTYYIEWDNGKSGICELRDLEVINE